MKAINLARANWVLMLLLTSAPAWAQRPLGCDIASYQSGISWTQVTNAGVKFCWAKATEGTGYINPYFTAQEAGAKAARVYNGAYHYALPSADPNITGANSADSEANYFWQTASNYVKFGGSYTVPMLDWEDPGVTTQYSAATMSAWVNEWCNTVSNAVGGRWRSRCSSSGLYRHLVLPTQQFLFGTYDRSHQLGEYDV